MSKSALALFATILLACTTRAWAEDSKPARKYFAHPVVEDRYGVIAPWYRGQNGQCDFRVRIAEETLKRYPWTEPGKSVMPGPHFIFNGCWAIKPDGTISVNPSLQDWDNGDVGQRSIGLLLGQTDYYRYTGDPAAIAIIAMTANYVLDYCQTPADHPWPRLFISCPTKGKAYGRADPHGFIQLDLCAMAGLGMVAAYKLTGDPRYWEAAKHWADLLAEHCNHKPAAAPWGRYANPQDVPAVDGSGAPWGPQNIQTGGVVLILRFLGDVIRTGYKGKGDSLTNARHTGERYLRKTLLPRWSRNPTFGCNYWDWANPVYTFAVATYACDYMMSRREAFPNWEIDVRNIMSQAFCRLAVNPESMGGIYSGTWALPEANNCCGKSLQYPMIPIAATWAQYADLTGSAWAKEIARRQAILGTYDVHETGVVEDLIDGGIYVAAVWFNLAHPWPQRSLLQLMSWQPELTGASRENHILRSASVVTDVHYGKGKIAYHTYDAIAPSEDVLRLAFAPKSVSADGKALPQRETLSENGYTVKSLPNGDCIVKIRHDGCRDVVVEGDDPQQTAKFESGVSFQFEGNQVRLIGRVDPGGGRADVYLDGVKQLCGIDFWCPVARDQQVLCYKNGLAQGKHTLKIVALGTKNPYSKGTRVYVDAVQWSAAQGVASFGEASGPADPQRVIFGYVKRKDYIDSQGHAWCPAAEYVLRLAPLADLEPIACWTEPKAQNVADTKDAELYRYGVHGKDFTAYFTVDPKLTYHARIKLCQADAPSAPGKLATTIDIQGKTVAADVDIAATAGGLGKAVDLVFNDIEPQHGVVAIRFSNRFAGEAMVQAIEIAPGRDQPGAKPVPVAVPPRT